MLSTCIAHSLDSYPPQLIAQISIATKPPGVSTAELFFEQYRKSGTLVVIRSLLDAEPEWNLSYLRAQLGDRVFPIRQYGWERYQQDKQQWSSMGSGVETRSMPFSQYASLLSHLYPFPVSGHLWHGLKRRASYSRVYPDRPDFVKFPKFQEAFRQRYEVILKQGDVLFIPVGWWHEVTALGEDVVCSVNRFWSVLPRQRAVRSWNKWRIHLGSVLAAPHIGWNLLTALGSHERYRELVQRI